MKRPSTPGSSMRALLDEARTEQLIEGHLLADGWVHLFIDGFIITLQEGQVSTFLEGMLLGVRPYRPLRRPRGGRNAA